MLKLWLQVTLEDNVAEFLYAPLFIATIAWIVCISGLVDYPHIIFLIPCTILFILLALRAFRNWLFIQKSELALAIVGQELGKFRKWREHALFFTVDGVEHRTKHVFLKDEVRAGDEVMILTRSDRPKSILVVRLPHDTKSLIG